MQAVDGVYRAWREEGGGGQEEECEWVELGEGEGVSKGE